MATFATSSLVAGNYTFTASYGGTTLFAPSSTSTNDAVTVTINPTPPTGGQRRTKTVVQATPKPATFGHTVTLTVTVTGLGRGRGTPTGDIDFFINGQEQTSPQILRRGKVIIKTSKLLLGPDSIRVDYIGTPQFASSTDSVFVTVKKPKSRRSHGRPADKVGL